MICDWCNEDFEPEKGESRKFCCPECAAHNKHAHTVSKNKPHELDHVPRSVLDRGASAKQLMDALAPTGQNRWKT